MILYVDLTANLLVRIVLNAEQKWILCIQSLLFVHCVPYKTLFCSVHVNCSDKRILMCMEILVFLMKIDMQNKS